MKIGELARRTSVSTRLLRYYEEQGLLTPVRQPNGYREYADDAPMIVGQIRGLLDVGLSSSTIRELLPCARGNGPQNLTSCPELVGILREAVADMESRIACLTQNRDALLRYLEGSEPVVSEPGGT